MVAEHKTKDIDLIFFNQLTTYLHGIMAKYPKAVLYFENYGNTLEDIDAGIEQHS